MKARNTGLIVKFTMVIDMTSLPFVVVEFRIQICLPPSRAWGPAKIFQEGYVILLKIIDLVLDFVQQPFPLYGGYRDGDKARM